MAPFITGVLTQIDLGAHQICAAFCGGLKAVGPAAREEKQHGFADLYVRHAGSAQRQLPPFDQVKIATFGKLGRVAQVAGEESTCARGCVREESGEVIHVNDLQ